MEKATWSHLGYVLEASGMHMGAWRHLPGVWGLSNDLECFGGLGSRLIDCRPSLFVRMFSQQVPITQYPILGDEKCGGATCLLKAASCSDISRSVSVRSYKISKNEYTQ